MKTFRIWLALFVLLTGAARAMAQTGVMYDCAFDKTDNKMLSPRVLMLQGDADKKVLVMDAYVKHIKGAPIEAKVVRDDAKRLDVTWDLKAQDSTNQHFTMHFYLVYFKKDGRASAQSKYLGFQNQYTARGSCTLRRGKI